MSNATDTNAADIIKAEVERTLVAPDPFGGDKTYAIGNWAGIVAAGNERVALRRRQLADLGPLADAPKNALRDLRDAIRDDDAALRGYAQRYADGVVEAVGLGETVKALAVQIKGPRRSVDPLSVRGKLAATLAEIEAELARREPPRPTHTYAIRVTCTDAALAKIMKAIDKEGGRAALAATPQSDAEAQQIIEWFARNA